MVPNVPLEVVRRHALCHLIRVHKGLVERQVEAWVVPREGRSHRAAYGQPVGEDRGRLDTVLGLDPVQRCLCVTIGAGLGGLALAVAIAANRDHQRVNAVPVGGLNVIAVREACQACQARKSCKAG